MGALNYDGSVDRFFAPVVLDELAVYNVALTDTEIDTHFDNGVFVVACNQVGNTDEGFFFPGAAVIVGPDGQVLAKYTGGEEKILYVELDSRMLSDVRNHRMKYFLPSRRPELYGKIVK